MHAALTHHGQHGLFPPLALQFPNPRPTVASPPQAAFSAAAKLCIRSLGSTEPVASIIFAMAAVSSAGSALFCALLPRHFVLPRTAAAWGLLVAAGLLGCCVQLLATTALKLSKAAPTIAMSYFAGARRVPQAGAAELAGARCSMPACSAGAGTALLAAVAPPRPALQHCHHAADLLLATLPLLAVVWGLLLDLAVYHNAPSLLSLWVPARQFGGPLWVPRPPATTKGRQLSVRGAPWVPSRTRGSRAARCPLQPARRHASHQPGLPPPPRPLACARRLGAALVCASSFIIVSFEARSKAAQPPPLLKAKDSGPFQFDAAAKARWQHLEAGVDDGAPGEAADAMSGQVQPQRQQRASPAGHLELAEGGRGSAAAGGQWQPGAAAEDDEHAPLVRPQGLRPS